MDRPQIRLVQAQSEESKEIQIDSYEAQELLKKYAYTYKEPEIQQPIQQVDNGLTYEQMLELDRKKKEALAVNRIKRDDSPKPITFSGDNYTSDVKYGHDSDSGFSFRIEITTDMKLPK
jgi:hypothetical protein